MKRLRYQEMIYFVKTIKYLTDYKYKDLKYVELKTKLPAKPYINLNSVYLCFPIKIK